MRIGSGKAVAARWHDGRSKIGSRIGVRMNAKAWVASARIGCQSMARLLRRRLPPFASHPARDRRSLTAHSVRRVRLLTKSFWRLLFSAGIFDISHRRHCTRQELGNSMMAPRSNVHPKASQTTLQPGAATVAYPKSRYLVDWLWRRLWGFWPESMTG
jgi:hypothetical protein